MPLGYIQRIEVSMRGIASARECVFWYDQLEIDDNDQIVCYQSYHRYQCGGSHVKNPLWANHHRFQLLDQAF